MANPIVQRVKAAKGNAKLADELIRDYLPFIKSEVQKLAPDARDGDELSIAMIAFHEAINSYQADRGAFLGYASVVMKNRIIDFYRSESRHQAVSLHAPIGDDLTLEDTLEDPIDQTELQHNQSATVEEIRELSQQLGSFGLSLTDISDDCPKQARTLEQCQTVILFAKDHPEMIQDLLRTKKLPITPLAQGSGVSKKILERHRKYLMALLIILSNGYELIRDHIGMTFIKKGGVLA